MKNRTNTVVLTTSTGFWSTGGTIAEAIKNLHKGGGLKRDGKICFSIVIGDESPTVDQYGGISYGGEGKENAELVNLGPISTVRTLRKRMKQRGIEV